MNKSITPVFSYLRDRSDEWNANGDYSVNPAAFAIRPETDEVLFIRRIIGHGAWFSSLGPAPTLPNGIEVAIYRGDQVFNDLLDGVAIRTLEDWNRVCFDIDVRSYQRNLMFFGFRWSFFKGLEEGLKLDGDRLDSLQIRLSDDMRDFDQMSFMAQGYKVGR